jgi:hypothetical protein
MSLCALLTLSTYNFRWRLSSSQKKAEEETKDDGPNKKQQRVFSSHKVKLLIKAGKIPRTHVHHLTNTKPILISEMIDGLDH